MKFDIFNADPAIREASAVQDAQYLLTLAKQLPDRHDGLIVVGTGKPSSLVGHERQGSGLTYAGVPRHEIALPTLRHALTRGCRALIVAGTEWSEARFCEWVTHV